RSDRGKFYEPIRKTAEAVGFHDTVRRLLSAIRRRRPSGGGSHMQTMDMRIDDGRTWLRQLRHFVNRAACTLWGPACRGAGQGGQLTALAGGMAVALAASPGPAVPAMPARGFGIPTPAAPLNGRSSPAASAPPPT